MKLKTLLLLPLFVLVACADRKLSSSCDKCEDIKECPECPIGFAPINYDEIPFQTSLAHSSPGANVMSATCNCDNKLLGTGAVQAEVIRTTCYNIWKSALTSPNNRYKLLEPLRVLWNLTRQKRTPTKGNKKAAESLMYQGFQPLLVHAILPLLRLSCVR